MVKSQPSIRLVVTSGQDAGAQLDVGGQFKLVGRARDAHLSLSDPSVSRRHFHIHAMAGELAYVQVCGDAAPIVHANRKITAGEVKVGDSILVGKTLLLVTEASGGRTSEVHRAKEVANTTIGALLTGAAADVVGVAAIFALNQTLSAATSATEVETILSTWARTYAECSRIDLHAEGRAQFGSTDEMPLLETATPDGGTAIVAPSRGAPTGWLAFHTTVSPPAVGDPLRRLLVLAAALAGAQLAHLSTLQIVRDDRDALRRLAIGSAQRFLGTSPAAEELVRLIARLAASEATALLTGETGVGKTFVARLIHEAGPRKDEPLRVINCAAIPETLIERELFGHARGAFTGATADQVGVFEAAEGGTVLLDEVGELPLASQAKLLRVLEDKQFERLGSTRSIPLRARVLVATNRDLDEMVAAGTFRRDLFFRITVIKASIPPLRERGDDVVLLAKKLLSDLASSSGRRVHDFSPEVLEAIRRYPWPGNVRELRNVIEHALVMGDGPTIATSDLPEAIRGLPRAADVTANSSPSAMVVELPMNEESLQTKNREAALVVTGGNKVRAAALLGIGRTTFYRK
ncbi:sigma 54-interacting transcriptional regulator [Pendulispora rubella]|uniref:Sigma 54-interacting transcriptional regulator n=1 Tax=Pendulispora rubella TaxID=2741070 RepID=A0ABZ2L2A5_9BACT